MVAFGPGDAVGRRYRFAGVMVPAVLTAFFAATVGQGSADTRRHLFEA